jgi:C1A family cysteine protease
MNAEKNTIITTNITKEDCLGWHAICIVGRIKKNGKWCFIVRNSWGVEWCDNGYGYIDEKWFKNNDLWIDAWTVRGHSY